MGCTIKERLIDTIKDEIKGNATSFKMEKERVFIPITPSGKIKNQKSVIETGTRIVNKINLKYKPWTKQDVVSLDRSLQEGAYINIHPAKDLIDVYQHYEDSKEYYDELEKNNKPGTQTELDFEDNIYIKQLINFFEKKLNIPANFISKQEAIALFGNKVKGSKGVYYNRQVYLIGDNIEGNTVIHEFIHPIVQELYEQNPQLFQNLYEELINTKKGSEILKDVVENYPEYFEENGVINPMAYLEVLTTGLEYLTVDSISKDNQFITILKKFWNEIKVFLSEFIDISELKPNTTLNEFVELIKNTKGIKISGKNNGELALKKNRKYEWDTEGTAFEQQQRFFKRRISDLEKRLEKLPEYSKEWENEKFALDELKERVAEANERQDEHLYFVLGEEILKDVGKFIENLRNGTQQPRDSYMEYAIDILNTWDEFPDLRDTTWKLRKALYPFIEDFNLVEINKYATEAGGISKEDVDAQNDDIRKWVDLGSKFFGSLSDSSNYLARTIGAVIKEAQNKASTNSKKKRDEIQKETDSLFAYCKRVGIPAIKAYDIFIQKSGNSTKLTTEYTEDGELNPDYEKIQNAPELKRFYDFYQKTIQEAQKDFPIKPGKNFIPNIAQNSISKTIKDINPVKERIIGEKVVTEEFLPEQIKLKFLKILPSEIKSKDLGNSLLEFYRSTEDYRELNAALPKVKLLQEGIKYKLNKNGNLEERKYRKGSNPKLFVNATDSNIYNMTEDVIKMQILGQMKSEELGFVISKEKDEDGNVKEKHFDTVGLLDNVLKYNSLLRIGFSPITAVTNIFFGDASNIIEAIGGRFFRLKDLNKATKIFFNQTLDENSTLNTLLEELNPLMELDDYQSISKGLKAKILSKDKLFEYMYSLQKGGEKFLQSRTMLAVMLKEELITPEGEVTEKYKKLNNEEKSKLTDKVQRLNAMIHGRYSQREAATLQQSVVYRMATQFRKWLWSAVEARFASKAWDNRLGVEFEGRYNTYFNLIKELLKYKGQLENGRKLTELEIYNLRKGISEIILALTTVVLYMLVHGGSDDDKRKARKNPVIKTVLTLLNRVSGDLSFFYDPTQITNLINNPIPAVRMVNDLLSVPGLIYDGTMNDNWTYKSGSRKDQIKLVNKLERILPVVKEVDTFQRMLNKQELEELK